MKHHGAETRRFSKNVFIYTYLEHGFTGPWPRPVRVVQQLQLLVPLRNLQSVTAIGNAEGVRREADSMKTP